MDTSLSGAQHAPSRLSLGSIGVFLPVGLLLAAWLLLTPEGLLGKADAVGYAVCHRIDLRSFHLGTRALPLCARCSGMYLGALAAFGGLLALGKSRHGGFPRPALMAPFGVFAALWAIDGLNSYLTLIPGAPHAYEPNNLLRLATGLLMGLTLGTIVFAGLNQNAWRNWRKDPVVGSFREVGGLVLLAAVVGGLVLTENPLILYPLALLSAAGVLLVLGLVYTVVALLVLRRENRIDSWAGLAVPMGLGLGLAVLQIGLLDLARLTLTGTWSGFSL
ncbi:MAG TPA: DUF2085 domain-containing protein [Anaerolineales bacterium]|nr:DUF2085 domain-containing protein [Anaerolineales bacterium]